jgi:NAD+ kinase
MVEKQPILKNILVLAHPNLPEAFSEATELASILKENGLRADYGSLYDEGLRTQAEAGEYELLIALGGDGTILRAGHLGGPCDIPILGINLGHFGFSDGDRPDAMALDAAAPPQRRLLARAANDVVY